MTPRSLVAWVALLLCGMPATAVHAQAADYPSKPVRVVVPFTAGSTTDVIARAITDKLSQALGQPVVVDNRAGAGGTLGAGLVAQAPPDGYTVLIHSSSHTVSPSTFAKLPFDTLKDFAGVTPIAQLPNVLVVAPSRNLPDLPSLLAYARSHPGRLNYASAGNGSATHLNAEKFKMQGKFFAVHIPYRGSPEAVTDVIAGRVDYYFSPVAPVLQHIRDGQLKALAVGSATRSAVLPDVPTTTEAGVAGSEFNFWIGMMVPAQTPRDIVQRLHTEVERALASPEVKERLVRLGAQAWTMKPEQFDNYLRDEVEVNARLVRNAGLKPQ
jgi:tripartite-type tricarboxylate transporter receptor subunit TctC